MKKFIVYFIPIVTIIVILWYVFFIGDDKLAEKSRLRLLAISLEARIKSLLTKKKKLENKLKNNKINQDTATTAIELINEKLKNVKTTVEENSSDENYKKLLDLLDN